MAFSVSCVRCEASLPPETWNRGEAVCATCGGRVQTIVFPASARGLGGSGSPGAPAAEGEASCFFHPSNRAVISCEACGRFVCPVCDVEFAGRHLCPTCLETFKKKGKWKNLENRRTLYGHIALALAIYPMLLFYFTILTAPIAIFVAIRHWRAPLSLVGGTKLPHIFAILIALLQIAGWIALAVFFFRFRPAHPRA